MAGTRIYGPLVVAAVAVTAAVGVASSGLLDPRTAVIVDDGAQLGAGLTAAVFCWWQGLRRTGVERSWRLLMAPGMAGWSVGQGIWSWYQIFGNEDLPSPSWADVGYFTLPVFALAALLVFATVGAPRRARPPSVPRARRLAWLVLVLDGLVVVGSLFILTWSTALGAVVRAGAATTTEFAVAVGYPVTDLILVVIVVLLVAAHRVVRAYRPQLLLLGLGLVALSVSDSIFAYLVSTGAEVMPPITNAGFVAGPALIAVAALATVDSGPVARGAGASRVTEWAHLMLPYLPVLVTGVLVVVQTVQGRAPDPVAMYLGLLVIVLVLLRQMITLIQNTVLLDQVVQGQQQLAYQAFHDPLTGLPNRALFSDRLTHAVELDRRDHRPVALLFVDLDDFKTVNDSLGHAAGDRLLGEVGVRLRGCIRSADTVARLGGDEFAVLLEGGADSPERVGGRILEALRRPFDVGGHTVTVGASIGVAISDPTEPGLSADALLRRADAAMYAGKRGGKGALVVYDAGLDLTGNPDLPRLLAAALRDDAGGAGVDSGDGDGASDGIHVHYQPIVRIEDGTPVAMEALARWTTPTLGSVPAEVFVGAAERSGLVAALDNLVLNRACREVASLAATQGRLLAVHVNISASRLADPDLESQVVQTLRRYDLPGDRLVLEITETSRIPDFAAAADVIQRLRDRGIRIALDDFGTGYNTLAQLHLLPLDIVKLSGAHTAVDGDLNRSEALCRSVVAIARSLGMTVIAEGVETAAQAGALARLGCSLGQGYLYGRSAPLSQVQVAGALVNSSVGSPRTPLRSSLNPAG